jgi:hypothetical protein
MTRTVGIEEELLVVNGESGRLLSVSERVLRRAAAPDQRAKAVSAVMTTCRAVLWSRSCSSSR